jgi:hypothetical protein
VFERLEWELVLTGMERGGCGRWSSGSGGPRHSISQVLQRTCTWHLSKY